MVAPLCKGTHVSLVCQPPLVSCPYPHDPRSLRPAIASVWPLGMGDRGSKALFSETVHVRLLLAAREARR